MKPTRRDLAVLLPALAAATASAADDAKISSHAFRFEDLPAHPNGRNISRPIFSGTLHTGFPIEAHETQLAPGSEPHPPHHHPHEEMTVMIEGAVDYTVNGVTTRLEPGGIGFVASNDEHGIRNNSSALARYAVIAFRG